MLSRWLAAVRAAGLPFAAAFLLSRALAFFRRLAAAASRHVNLQDDAPSNTLAVMRCGGPIVTCCVRLSAGPRATSSAGSPIHLLRTPAICGPHTRASE